MKLTRRDVEAIAACVDACSPRDMVDGRDVSGPLDDLVAKLRALWAWVGPTGLALPEVSAKAGGEQGAGPGRPDTRYGGSNPPPCPLPSPSAGAVYAELAEADGVPDPVALEDTAVEATNPHARPSTVEAVRRGVANAEASSNTEDPATPRRRRRTRAIGE